MASERIRHPVLDCPIDVATPGEAVARISCWAQERESRAVYFCNAHSVVTTTRSSDFARVIDAADLALPDGTPVAWMLRRAGRDQVRVPGPDLMLACCRRAEHAGQSVFLYGADLDTLTRLSERLRARLPALRIAGMIAPPFRDLTEEEDESFVARINASGAHLVFVGLGCPRQERWIDAHRGRVQAVMLGVGAAFGFHAGTVARAPRWVQRIGLEWLFRLLCEPRKLWRRYLVTNSLFIIGVLRAAARRAWRSRP